MTCVDCGRTHSRRCTPRCMVCAETRREGKAANYRNRYYARNAAHLNKIRRRKYLAVSIARTEAKLARLKALAAQP